MNGRSSGEPVRCRAARRHTGVSEMFEQTAAGGNEQEKPVELVFEGGDVKGIADS
jgi:hypothetical protein